MKELSREEKEEKLEQEIYRMADRCDAKKWKRVKITYFVILGAIYLTELPLILGGLGNISNVGFDIICGLVFAPLVAAGFIMFLAWAVLSYIASGALEDEKAIAKKMGELNAVRYGKYAEYNEEKAKQTKKELKDLIDFLKEIDEEYQYILDKEYEEPEEQLKDLKDLLQLLHHYYGAVSIGMDEDI